MLGFVPQPNLHGYMAHMGRKASLLRSRAMRWERNKSRYYVCRRNSMSQVITAVYEQGLLHPAVPLDLQEHESVRIHVLHEKTVDKTEQIIHFLVQIGMLTLPKQAQTTAPVSESERHRLSRILGKAMSKPLSEIVIEERG